MMSRIASFTFVAAVKPHQNYSTANAIRQRETMWHSKDASPYDGGAWLAGVYQQLEQCSARTISVRKTLPAVMTCL